MDEVKSKLTVFFEDPFYVGIIEREYKNKLEVCKITFGSEPTTVELLSFFYDNYYNLNFMSDNNYKKKDITHLNPKRIKRLVGKEMKRSKISTKSQELLKKQYEERKSEVKSANKKEKADKKEALFKLRQMKKKEKHKGR